MINIADIVMIPVTIISSFILFCIRRAGVHRMPMSRKVFHWVGIFPIREHYYEPSFNSIHYNKAFDRERSLPGIDLNITEQLEILDRFSYNSELERLPLENTNDHRYYYRNVPFGSGDSEYLYNMVRLFKPKRIIEIGCGFSTLMTIEAINANMKEDRNYRCEHICVEPYEQPWLENTSAQIIRKKIEDVDKEVFKNLVENDILFIDSSHVIRPQGDVLFEYLEVLPILNKGVILHVHDIFTPYDYPKQWVVDEVKFWNEQYLLESFLSMNKEYRIIGSLNHLAHNFYEELTAKCPVHKKEPFRALGSFWMVRN
jgi:hypothetical protein